MSLNSQNSNALPGVSPSTVTIQPKEIWYGDFQPGADHYLPGFPLVLDGTKVNNAANAPYNFLSLAGTFIGQQNASGTNPGKYAASIIGLTAAAYTANATTVTLDAPTALAMVSRQGATGTFSMVGPATATTGSLPTTLTPVTFTYSAVNTTTGAVTVTAVNQAFIVGSLVLPTDGTQYPRTIIGSKYGLKSTDWTNINQIDVLIPIAYQSGLLRTTGLNNYPADLSSRNWIKQALRVYCPSAMFEDDFVYGI